MAALLQDLMWSFQSALDNFDLKGITPVEMIDMLNNSQEELIHQLPTDCLVQLTASSTGVTGTLGTEVTIPGDMHRKLFMTLDGKQASFVPAAQGSGMTLTMPTRYAATAAERPIAWFDKGTSASIIKFYPPLTSKTWVLHYLRVPSRMTADADVCGIAEKETSLLIDLALIKALTSRGKDPSQVVARYKNNLEATIATTKDTQPVA
jgi:hypothetical protein